LILCHSRRDRPTLISHVQSEWFRDALLDLPPTSTRITLVATPATNDVPDQGQGGSATVSSNNRRANRTKVGSFSIQAEGDFGSTEVSYNAVTFQPCCSEAGAGSVVHRSS
jgi:cell cycle checkpoint protein